MGVITAGLIDDALEKSTDERERRAIGEFIDWF